MRLLVEVVDAFFVAEAAGALLAVVDFAVLLVAADFVAVLRVVAALAVDFVAGELLAAVLLAALLLADVVRPAVFLVVDDERGVVDFDAAERAVVVFLAAAVPARAVVFLAAVLLAVVALVVVAFGILTSPETYFFSWAPALNFGTAVFLARLRSPVRGLRTILDGRMTFSNAPKPVMATFSPLTSSRVTMSMTDSRACPAAFLFPS